MKPLPPDTVPGSPISLLNVKYLIVPRSELTGRNPVSGLYWSLVTLSGCEETGNDGRVSLGKLGM